ncbi:large-conductance mechanosensitive channel protein MscL [Pseudidiomarina sp.]|uniref:large-conductance mechanosensitive channel protein MscL n=1 Tax=Pseudidiomarina sp. TaxID=2081707 RepID=UPI00299D9C60|nr:large-conductance mechanosensitive channel protein MscL [Pseudidiomarina sp.]MDX1706714.1 large-conductance mechanosensitive channel protein MscL [Pseudidiomarina sp.]
MSVLQEFKKFALRGNVVDMAVGIIIGAAFGRVVSSFVADIVMPPLGVMIGGVSFSQLAWVIQDATETQPEVAILYGKFIQSTVDFIIVAFAIFIAIKVMNSLKKKQEEAPKAAPKPSGQEVLLTEIRDLLKKSKGTEK